LTPQRGKRSAARSGTDFDQLLLQAALFLIVTILAAGAYLVYYTVSHQGLPSSFADKAAQDARIAYLASPQDSSVVADYVRALIADDKLGMAEDIVEEFRSLEATAPAPFVTVEEARIEWTRGNTENALALLEAAKQECEDLRARRIEGFRERGIEAEPQMPEIIRTALLHADVLESEGRFAEGVAVLDWALEEDPTMADVLVRRGGFYAAQGDAEKAKADYERALAMIPDFGPALEGLGALDD